MLDPHRSPHHLAVTYSELNDSINAFGASLSALGVQQGDRVCLFAESSPRWIVADQAILLNGAADAVSGRAAE